MSMCGSSESEPYPVRQKETKGHCYLAHHSSSLPVRSLMRGTTEIAKLDRVCSIKGNLWQICGETLFTVLDFEGQINGEDKQSLQKVLPQETGWWLS